MRVLVVVLLTAISAAHGAHAGDFYPPPPYAYGYQPPPVYQPPPAGYAPGPAYAHPPAIAYGAPAYAYRPQGVIAAPEGPAYIVPGPVYQAGDEYVQGPVYVDGARYWRECRWEFGYRRCFLRHKAWLW